MIRASLTMGSFARSSKGLEINTQGLETKDLLARPLGLWSANVKANGRLSSKQTQPLTPGNLKFDS